jgi:hypothetical protein
MNAPRPNAPNALAVTEGADTIGQIVEQDGIAFAFDASGTLIGEYATRTLAMRAIPPLNKQADAIPRTAHRDTITGTRKDKHYRRAHAVRGGAS